MRKAQQEWLKKHTKIVPIRLNFTTDRDILEYLSRKKSMTGYIKKLIRADMKAKGIVIPHPSIAEQKAYAEYLCDLEFGEIDPNEEFKYERKTTTDDDE